jgi:CrcB protein
MFKILAVFLGGAIGSLLRWFLAVKLNPAVGAEPAFPTGTLTANLIGGFLIGLLMALLLSRDWPEEVRLLLITGLLGGLTTFSAFSWEIVNFMDQNRFDLGIMTLVISLAGSLGLTAAGLMLGRLLFKA